MREIDDVDRLIGTSAAIRQIEQQIDDAAGSDAKVLVTGESGSGKEVVARLVHQRSARRHARLVAINCAGLPDSLLESELFGHVRGAFTGAYRDKTGLLEFGHRGTVFLDEVGEMSLRMQAVLLRFLETGEVHRVGGDRAQERVDVRVIAATNRDLRQLVQDGKFLHDLYYRLAVIPIEIPPLRERREDIRVLVEHFVRKHARRIGRRIDRIDEAAFGVLEGYDWPGNVRELENTVERAVVLSRGPVLAADAISIPAPLSAPPTGLPSLRLRQNIEWTERETLRRALESAGGVKKDAAELMGISQRAISYYLSKYKPELADKGAS